MLKGDKMKKNTSGFTLIEFMLWLAAAAGAAAIALPAIQ
jgi:Tfp pilus assembly major pilin PilA